MKRLLWLYSALGALLFGCPAFAADLPIAEPMTAAAVPSLSWSGAYLGVQGGYGWLHSDNKVNGASADTRASGFTVGAFAGFNYQAPESPVVFGVEGDVNYVDARDSAGSGVFGPGTRLRTDMDWSGAVRARVGYAFDQVMLYGAGGVAFADRGVKSRGAVAGSDDKLAVGWTVGGGVETVLANGVTARVEYRYADYGIDSFSVAGNRVKADATDNRVLLGVGYRFSSGW